MYKIEIYILNDRLELFKDENIQLESSVQNIKDISKIFTDYTQSFTVPASQDNNKIFKHWYNSEIVAGFDSNKLVNAEIKLNGVTYKVGKVKLESVALKNNKAQNYKIKFFGKLINLNTLFGEDLLSDLDLTAYSHDYNSLNVQIGLQYGLSGGDVIYPLISSARNWDYNTNVTENEIKYTNSTGGGIVWNELKPALKINRIIEAIETKYGISFSTHFFKNATNDIDKLFIWLNGTKAGEVAPNSLTVDFDGGSSTKINLSTNIGSYHSEKKPRQWWQLYLTVTPSSGYENINYTISFFKKKNDGEMEKASEINKQGSYNWKNTIPYYEGGDYEVYWTVAADTDFKFTTSCKQQRRDYWGKDGSYTTTSSEQTIESNFLIKENTPKMKVKDFLASLIKMFNLVIDPITLNSFQILPLKDWYNLGGTQDLTKFIDIKDYEVKRPDLFKNINFKYQEAKDILGEAFRDTYKIGYGDLKATFDVDGGNLDVELSFQNLLMERITDTTTGDLTDIHIGNSFDKSFNEILIEPILFFNRGRTELTTTLGYVNDSGNATPLYHYLNVGQESSTTEGESNYSLNFGGEISTWNYGVEVNSLYNVFWKDYVTDLYNSKRREYDYTAYLPLNVINTLKLNDLVIIAKKSYIINSLSTNLSTGLVKLNLLNYVGETLVYKNNETVNEKLKTELIGNSSITAILDQYKSVSLLANLTGSSLFSFDITQNGITQISANLVGSSSIFAMGLSGGISSGLNLQQVTDVGNTTTNIITSYDSLGGSVNLYPEGVINCISPGSSYFMYMQASTAQLGGYNGTSSKTTLQFPAATAAHTINIPNKAGTFALLDDITGGGIALTDLSATTPVSYNNTTGVFSHSAAAGDKHIPTGGTVGQILKNTASGTATWQNESAGILGYKVYVALISQLGTSAPTAIILQNTLGVVPVWTRFSTGIYRATYANTFTQDKTTILTSTNYLPDSGIIQVTCNSGYSPDMIQLISYNKTMVLTDALLVRTAIEIRVYPSAALP